MNIYILTIPNEEIAERAGFSGADWFFDTNGDLQIRIAKMSNLSREKCLIVHEMVESLLFHAKHGTDVSAVDEFDRVVEEAAPEKHGIDAGDQKDCPYAKEHAIAICAERAVFAHLSGIDPGLGSWREYDDELGAL